MNKPGAARTMEQFFCTFRRRRRSDVDVDENVYVEPNRGRAQYSAAAAGQHARESSKGSRLYFGDTPSRSRRGSRSPIGISLSLSLSPSLIRARLGEQQRAAAAADDDETGDEQSLHRKLAQSFSPSELASLHGSRWLARLSLSPRISQ